MCFRFTVCFTKKNTVPMTSHTILLQTSMMELLYENNPLSANPTKWSNTLKQFVDNLPINCLIWYNKYITQHFLYIDFYASILVSEKTWSTIVNSLYAEFHLNILFFIYLFMAISINN